MPLVFDCEVVFSYYDRVDQAEMLPPILTSSTLGVRKRRHNLEDQETNEDSHYNDKEVIGNDQLEFQFKQKTNKKRDLAYSPILFLLNCL